MTLLALWVDVSFDGTVAWFVEACAFPSLDCQRLAASSSLNWIFSPMPDDQTRNVSLTAEINAFIRTQVASGQYQNASEVVRAGLRLLMKQVRRDNPQGLLRIDGPQKPRATARGRHARQS